MARAMSVVCARAMSVVCARAMSVVCARAMSVVCARAMSVVCARAMRSLEEAPHVAAESKTLRMRMWLPTRDAAHASKTLRMRAGALCFGPHAYVAANSRRCACVQDAPHARGRTCFGPPNLNTFVQEQVCSSVCSSVARRRLSCAYNAIHIHEATLEACVSTLLRSLEPSVKLNPNPSSSPRMLTYADVC
jgi:hypothetical protein